MILVDGLILATDGATKLYLLNLILQYLSRCISRIAWTEIKTGPLTLSNGKLLIRDQGQMNVLSRWNNFTNNHIC